jgi:hypothetical protein
MAKKKQTDLERILNGTYAPSIVSNRRTATNKTWLSSSTKKKDEDDLDKILNGTFTTSLSRKSTTSSKKEDEKRAWFSSGAFSDGYQIGDITKTLLGTSQDITENIYTGAAGIVEKGIDAGANILGWFGNDDFKQKMADFQKKDLIDEEKIGKYASWTNPNALVNRIVTGGKTEENSVLGEKTDSLVQSGGQLGATMGLQMLGVPWWLTTGVTSYGGATEEALKNGASYGEASAYGVINAAAETLIEKISGGISFGGKTLDDTLLKPLTDKITDKTAKTLIKFGIDAFGEGGEEVLTEVVNNVGKKLTYEDEKTWSELLTSEEAMESYLEAAIGGFVMGGGFNVKRTVDSIRKGRDYDTGFTDNEQKVIDTEINNRTTEIKKQKAVEDRVNQIISEREKTFGTLDATKKKAIKDNVMKQLDNGEIDFDSVQLNKKEITNIQKEVENSLKAGEIDVDTIESILSSEKTTQIKELNEQLGKTTNPQEKSLIQAKIDELTNVKNEELRKILKNDDFLQNSYREANLSKQNFEYEVKETDSEYKKALAEEFKSKKTKNTTKTHNIFEMLSKVSEEKQTQYHITTNEELKELGYEVDGKDVNGLVRVTEDGDTRVLVNIDSKKALNRIVGHETTHLLEGTTEYTKLQQLVKEYATTKGDYDTKLKNIKNLYKDVSNADIDGEVTADLVGDYLFTDTDFVNNLSVKEPNIFQKIYNEIKHLYKMATAGSKEARQLEKVKKAFEDAYRKNGKVSEDVKYSLTEELENNLDKVMQNKKAMIDYFNDYIETEGITNPTEQDIKNSLDSYDVYDAEDGFNQEAEAEYFDTVKEYLDNKNTTTTDLKQKQLDIILKENPMTDDYHTGIRTIEDIKTFDETINDDESFVWGDFSQEDAKKALEKGEITIYSSYPIEQGVFVSTSKNQAQDYAGGGKVYSKTVPLNEVAWINGDEGQYAKVSESKLSLSNQDEQIAPSRNDVFGSDIKLQVEEAIAPLKEEISELKETLEATTQQVETNLTTEDYSNTLTEEDLPYFEQQYQEDIKNVGELEYAPINENLTIEEQDELETLESMDDRFGLEGEQLDRYNELLAKQNNIGEETYASMEDTSIKKISNNFKKHLGLKKPQVEVFEKGIKELSAKPNLTKEDVFNFLDKNYGTESIKVTNDSIVEAQGYLRETGLNVSDVVKGDIRDYFQFRQSNFGKIRFSKDGASVDQNYQELNSMFPDLFPSDIYAESDQLIRMSEVANMQKYDVYNEKVDLQEEAEFIYESILDYRYNEGLKASDRALKEARNYYKNIEAPTEVVEDIAPIKETTAGNTAEQQITAENPVEEKKLSVKEANALKLKNYETSLENMVKTKEQSFRDFNSIIDEKLEQYDDLKNKNTQKANNILRQVNRLKAQRDNTQIEYDRRIGKIQERIEKMNSKEFKTAEQRITKQEEYRTQARNLIGDTSKWKDKKMGIQYQINTFKRNLRDIVRGADGKQDINTADAIYEEYQGKYNKNEAKLRVESNKLKQKFIDKKLTKEENVYIQMLGELKYNPSTTLTQEYVDSYYERNANKIDVDKVNETIEEARQLYDELFERINETLRSQGMKEMEYKRGYFPHFVEEKQGILAKLFDWKIKNDQIPTDIAGLTELNNPERSWQSFNKHRTTDVTDYNFSKGLDTYVQGALDWIYHIEDIQKRRALENEIRYQHSDEGVKQQIEEIYNDTELDADQVQERIDAVLKVAGNPLNNFVTDLRNSTNNLAGKKSTLDRSLEYATNRRIYSTMTNISNRVSGNMIAGSISSALTNFIPITQSWGQVNPMSSLNAARETIANAIKDDGTIAKSTFLTNRLVKTENLYKSNWDKAQDKVAIMTDVIDSFTSQVIWRSKYNENIKNGMSEAQAIADADRFAENVIAGRSRGNEPTIFNSKNPITKMFTAFQLEVANQYNYMFKDMPIDIDSKGKLVKGYATMFVGAYVYNALYSSLVGRDVAFDPIGLIEDILKEFGFGDDEEEDEKPLGEKFTSTGEKLVQQLPFVGGLFGGGRVPLSAAIPYENPIEMVFGTGTDILNTFDEEKREKALKDLTSEWLKPITYLALPFGGGQISKTIKGLSMYDDDLPIAGSYTNSGDLRFTADESIGGKVKAALFGQWASDSAQEYVDSGFKTVKKDDIEEMIDLGMTSTEYRKLKQNIDKASETKNAKGYVKYTDDNGAVYWYDKTSKTLYDNNNNESDMSILNLNKTTSTKQKIEYINSLDLTTEQKNTLVNSFISEQTTTDQYGYQKYIGTEINKKGKEVEKTYWYDDKNDILYDSEYEEVDDLFVEDLTKAGDREIDMGTYNDLSSYEEFDFSYKNPKKYQWLNDNNISYDTYAASKESKEAYNWAYNNPEKYKLTQQIDTLENYFTYKNSIADIKEQYSKDNGYETEERKYAVQEYINSLDLSVPQKLMLQKTAGNYSIKDYEDYMYGYINSLDLSAKEKQELHNQLFD